MDPQPSTERKCRWGFLGTAGIASKNRLSVLAAPNAELVAIASRSLEKAQQWALEKNVPKSYGSYEELLDDPEIDAVYIPLPSALHCEWVEKAAEKGKHVLCEKPIGISVDEAVKMINVCRSNGVQFMDGVMFMHHDRLRLMDALIDNEIGSVGRMYSGFSFPGDEEFLKNNIRSKADTEPLGCLGDLGWYNVRITLWAKRYELPVHVQARNIVWRNGVPIELDADIVFADGTISSFHNSFVRRFRQWVEVIASKAVLRFNDFVITEAPRRCSYEIDYGSGPVDVFRAVDQHREVHEVNGCCQEGNMFTTFSDIVLGRAEKNSFWPEVSLKTQIVVDALFESIREGGTRVNVDHGALKRITNN